jgi:hypothetical protein
MARYHVSFRQSGTGVVHKFLHTVFQFVSGQSLSIRISRVDVSVCIRVNRTSYIRLLYVLADSVGPRGVMYAESISSYRRYSNLAGILFLLGGSCWG